jgi:hypothetical protein
VADKIWVTFPSGRRGFYADVASRPRSPEKPEGYVYPVNMDYMKATYTTYHWLWVMGKPGGERLNFNYSNTTLLEVRCGR